MKHPDNLDWGNPDKAPAGVIMNMDVNRDKKNRTPKDQFLQISWIFHTSPLSLATIQSRWEKNFNVVDYLQKTIPDVLFKKWEHSDFQLLQPTQTQ
jgi:hypothetical protein